MENIKPLGSAELKATMEKFHPFLMEVRKRLFALVAIFAVATIGGFVFYENIIRFLIKTLSLEGVNIVFTSPFQFINLAIACGVATGLIFIFPLFVYQVLSFLKPALREREYKTVVRFLPFSLLLFLTGAAFGALVMKWQIQIFVERSVSLGIGNMLDISRLLTVVLITSGVMGIAFQFPIVLFLLLRLGVIKNEQLAKQRLWIYVGAIMFAILLPLDSILADILIALPLVILFEGILILNKILGRKKAGKVILEGA